MLMETSNEINTFTADVQMGVAAIAMHSMFAVTHTNYE